MSHAGIYTRNQFFLYVYTYPPLVICLAMSHCGNSPSLPPTPPSSLPPSLPSLPPSLPHSLTHSLTPSLPVRVTHTDTHVRQSQTD